MLDEPQCSAPVERSARSRIPLLPVFRLGYGPWGGGRRPGSWARDMSVSSGNEGTGAASGGVYDPPVSLTGKRVLITGGAGFIGTTLAGRLVDANEVVAVDNLHRDALSGTDLVGHPNFR